MAKNGQRWNHWARAGWDLAREAGVTLLAGELYPLGLAPRRAPRRRRTSGHRLPLVMLHGVFHNPSAFTWMRGQLHRRGYTATYPMDLVTSRRSVPALAEALGGFVEKLCADHGTPQVHLVGHSLGGLVARYYLQELGGSARIGSLVTLGTPHQGTPWSKLAPLAPFRDLQPHSSLLDRLSATPPPASVKSVSLSGERDWVVRPHWAWWEGARNLQLRGLGHTGLLFSRRVLEILWATTAPASPRKRSLITPQVSRPN